MLPTCWLILRYKTIVFPLELEQLAKYLGDLGYGTSDKQLPGKTLRGFAELFHRTIIKDYLVHGEPFTRYFCCSLRKLPFTWEQFITLVLFMKSLNTRQAGRLELEV